MTSPGADGGSQLRARVELSNDIEEILTTGEDSTTDDNVNSVHQLNYYTYPVEGRSGR